MGVYGAGLYGSGVYSGTTVLTAVQDSAWPPRIIVEATNLSIGATVTLYRVVGGVRTPVRSASDLILTDPSLVRYDGEYPFGVPVSYVVTENGSDTASSTPFTPSLPGGKVALSDAITGLSAEVVISAWPEKTNERQSSRFVVGGRTVVVSSPRGDAESQVEFLTEAESSRQQMIALLNGATSGIILIRQPGGYEGVDGTYFVLSDTEARAAQSGKLERRLWTLDLVEAPSGWAASLPASGWTFQDVTDAYTGLTFANLTADFATFLDIAVHDWGAP